MTLCVVIFKFSEGVALNGLEHILDIKPTSLHQRSAFVVGPEDMMNTFTSFMSQTATSTGQIMNAQ